MTCNPLLPGHCCSELQGLSLFQPRKSGSHTPPLTETHPSIVGVPKGKESLEFRGLVTLTKTQGPSVKVCSAQEMQCRFPQVVFFVH